MSQKPLLQRALPPSSTATTPAAATMEGPQHRQLSRLACQLNAGPPLQRAARTDGLPAPLQAGIESLSGIAMDGVKVHYNSSQPAQLQAHAFAQGSHIHLAPGQERHLPHEAWHVVQQAQGRVAATTQLKPALALNDDPGLEREADVMGARALQLKPAFNAPTRSDLSLRSRVAQRAGDDKDKPSLQQQIPGHLVHASGAVLQSFGFLLAASIARKPQYAKLAWNTFRPAIITDVLKLKVSLASVMVGNHLMGTDDLLGAATHGTALDKRPKLTANQDIFNWIFGLGHGVVGGVIGHRALSLGQGLGKVPLRNLGALTHVLLVYQLLSTSAKLMGAEGNTAESVRAYRGVDKHSGTFPHSDAKENANDLISQALFTHSLLRLNTIARMSKVPGFAPFARMRSKAMSGAALLYALNLSPASKLFPLLLGQSPDEVRFDPKHNPLDVSRTLIGGISAVLGAYGLNQGVRQAWLAMKELDRIKLLASLRRASIGGTALYGGLTLLQLLPVLYKLSHGEDKPGSAEDEK